MRRELIRKLQGEFKVVPVKDRGPKPKSHSVENLTDADNADNRWARNLRKEDFEKLKRSRNGKDLLWIWSDHRALLQDGGITGEINEFVHSKSTRNYFAAAIRHASREENSEYGSSLEQFESLFEHTYDISVDDAADEIKNDPE